MKVKHNDPVALVKARYLDHVNHPGTAYSGNTAKLLKGLRGEDRQKALEWLHKKESYILHRPAPKRQGKFPRQKIVTGDVGDCWEIDLSEMRNDKWYIRQNRGYRFILVAIDQFSRYVWTEPLKNKKMGTVVNALETIIKRAHMVPVRISCDNGKEFYNRDFDKMMKDWGVSVRYSSEDDYIKSPMVERVQKTLKNLMTKFMEEQVTWNWVDSLPIITRSYNMSDHRSLGTSPLQVLHMDPQQTEELWQRQYNKPVKGQRFKQMVSNMRKFQVGDLVRIVENKKMFAKGHTANFTREVFKIYDRVYTGQGLAFRVKDMRGDPQFGIYYPQQMVRHYGPANVSRIIDTVVKDDKNKEQVTVKFLGWGKKHNQTMSYIQFNKMLEKQKPRKLPTADQ